MANTYTYSRREEVANAVTHGIGAALSVAALVILIVFSSMKGTAWHVVSFTIYGITMLLLYTSSTLVHAWKDGKVKDLFEIFDHSSIYLFIAGSYTPLLFIAVRGTLGWTLFGIIWGIALFGVIFKAFLRKGFYSCPRFSILRWAGSSLLPGNRLWLPFLQAALCCWLLEA